MRHPPLLGNKQPQALSKLGGGHSLVWGALGSLPGAPTFSSRPWKPAHDCWNLWLSLGHRGDSSCSWYVDARGVAVAGCLVIPHVLASFGGLLVQACLQPGLSTAQDDGEQCVQSSGLDVAISQGDCGPWLGLYGPG